MMRWNTNWPGLSEPKWQSRHTLAFTAGSFTAHMPLATLSAWLAFTLAWLASQRSDPPWQASQPTPSDCCHFAPRNGAGSPWQLMHSLEAATLVMPRRLPMAWARGSFSTFQARLCAPVRLAGSDQLITSFWRTRGPVASWRPWQVELPQLATPWCTAGSIGAAANGDSTVAPASTPTAMATRNQWLAAAMHSANTRMFLVACASTVRSPPVRHYLAKC